MLLRPAVIARSYHPAVYDDADGPIFHITEAPWAPRELDAKKDIVQVLVDIDGRTYVLKFYSTAFSGKQISVKGTGLVAMSSPAASTQQLLEIWEANAEPDPLVKAWRKGEGLL